jgi:hypothetical protein
LIKNSIKSKKNDFILLKNGNIKLDLTVTKNHAVEKITSQFSGGDLKQTSAK